MSWILLDRKTEVCVRQSSDAVDRLPEADPRALDAADDGREAVNRGLDATERVLDVGEHGPEAKERNSNIQPCVTFIKYITFFKEHRLLHSGATSWILLWKKKHVPSKRGGSM
jgi:hypothetical protein